DNGSTCYATDSVKLLNCYVPLQIPNAFTPNGDAKNDLFRPVTLPERISTFKMVVYDRWGTIACETNDLTYGWDGMIAGKPAQPGVYVYIIKYGNPSGFANELKGTVTLLK
ncbi:MAG: T9SS type B sorting domain-containing protein, partial [Bacteroidota bacterium]